ncbi:leader peptidase (prepilin peptidase)/N-methyltransferase [Microbacteriaceae bacterium SG_E_30_P1]|uniref:Leader peptidase (Prepilin peptidase)/N-methyltransferase n=1 Tax=Antiquaquibacter oligotrophicus TaxID=2880260 RepID=A0ABT6KQN5_9MICO|nr:A24 family peptidase [Antiquaquibacter oligotrophicus]MDH6182293.1 leader peptidase (prepilin peptidase)/N-methyltransferase [Antiquaquibacter oligotrophicus]UDF12051.1 A24 family peptidase [Antiquaquibacter oligotrophicus]
MTENDVPSGGVEHTSVPTAPRYRAVAWIGGTAVAIALTAVSVARMPGSPVLLVLAPFAVVSVVLAAIDLRRRIIPNRIVLPSLVIVLVLGATAALLDDHPLRAVWMLAGSAALFVIYLVPAVVAPGSVGFGDVKLAAVVGAVLGIFGLQVWFWGAIAGFFVGALMGLVGMAIRRLTLRSRIPFAPAMLVGAWLAVLIVAL